MTPREFKAWFDGFTEAMHGELPTAKQWKRIKSRVAEIDNMPTTERIFVERYWPHYVAPYFGTAAPYTVGGISSTSFNADMAMLNLGKADYTATLR